MKVLPLIIAFGILYGTGAVAAPDNYTFSGGFVASNYVGPKGYTSVYILTNRQSAAPKEKTTYMVLAKQTCDEVACVEVVAYGLIPNDDFFYTTTYAELSTTIVPSADLETRAIRVEIGTGVTTQLPPPSGDVSLSFRATRAVTQSYHGSVTRSSGGVTIKEIGFDKRTSALVSGAILETQVLQKGEIASGHGKTITVSTGVPTP